MLVWAHDEWRFPLPEGHKFPLDKYALLRDRVVADGLVAPEEVRRSEPVAWEALERVQSVELLERIRSGTMTDREVRGLGLPWSAELVERGRRSTQGTVCAARWALDGARVAMNLGGGTHHAGWDVARGYCLFNDIAVTVDELRRAGLARRFLVVDCDVHQGDGTAQLLGPDPDVWTLSLHCARNWPFTRIPSDRDVELPAGTGDAEYLAALDSALGEALDHGPFDLAFYLAGADPWEGDRLGRLALTKSGLRARDELVLDRVGASVGAVCVVLAGGYAPDVRDTVDINAATARAVWERAAGGRGGGS